MWAVVSACIGLIKNPVQASIVCLYFCSNLRVHLFKMVVSQDRRSSNSQTTVLRICVRALANNVAHQIEKWKECKGANSISDDEFYWLQWRMMQSPRVTNNGEAIPAPRLEEANEGYRSQNPKRERWMKNAICSKCCLKEVHCQKRSTAEIKTPTNAPLFFSHLLPVIV